MIASHPKHVPFEWWYDDFAAELDEPGTDAEGFELESAAAREEAPGDDEIARASEELDEG